MARSSSKGFAVTAVVAGVYLAAHLSPGSSAPPASHPGAPAPATVTAISAAGSYTPASYAAAVLAKGGWQVTACNVSALVAWQAAEGDWTHGHAWWHNPFNDTYAGPGGVWLRDGHVAATVNSIGVRAYNSWGTGLTAVEFTLRGPDYGPIRAALAAGNNAQAVADAVASSPWGTQPFAATCP